MKRREFVKLCGAAVAGVSASPELLGEGNRELHFYERVALIDNNHKQPVRASGIDAELRSFMELNKKGPDAVTLWSAEIILKMHTKIVYNICQ